MTLLPIPGSDERTCGGCRERIYLTERIAPREPVWNLVLKLQADTTACYPGGHMTEDAGPHQPSPPLSYEECKQIASGDPDLLEWLEQPERNRLMRQACGDCGAEAAADEPVVPVHFSWCSTLRK